VTGRPASRAAIIAAIVRKDFKEFSRDRLYVFLSALMLVFFIGIFWVVPSTVDESIVIGIYQTGIDELGMLLQQEGDESGGLELVPLASEEDLKGVIAGDLEAYRTVGGDIVTRDEEAGDEKPKDAERVRVAIGIAFPEGFAGPAASGVGTAVTVYSDADVPPEIQGAMKSLVRELAFSIAGHPLPVELPAADTVILGQDRAGNQVAMRDRMRPLFVFFVLMMETFALASLISSEVMTRTVLAVLVTPAKLGDVLAAKTIFGTLLALSQALILLVAVGALTAQNWSVLIVAALIGALMFTAIGMMVGAAGKDFIGTIFYAMLFVLPLAIPAFAVFFPGTASAWIRVIPSYGLIQTITGVSSYSEGWADVWPHVATTLAWVVVLYMAGLFVLKRKVESL